LATLRKFLGAAFLLEPEFFARVRLDELVGVIVKFALARGRAEKVLLAGIFGEEVGCIRVDFGAANQI
jgi:hypothetical protein